MSNLYYITHKLGKEVHNNKVVDYINDNEVLRERHKNDFNIQIFGDAILPKDAASPLFRCRNMVANLNCTFVGTDEKLCIAAPLSEAYLRTHEFNGALLVINIALFDMRFSEDVEEVLKNLYNIISYETEQYFGVKDNIIVYWELDEQSYDIVNKHPVLGDFATLFVRDNTRYLVIENNQKG